MESADGAIFVEISPDPLQITKYCDLVADPGAGAIATFTGTTRDNFQGKSVINLDYEAYTPMAIKMMQARAFPYPRWETDITLHKASNDREVL